MASGLNQNSGLLECLVPLEENFKQHFMCLQPPCKCSYQANALVKEMRLETVSHKTPDPPDTCKQTGQFLLALQMGSHESPIR